MSEFILIPFQEKYKHQTYDNMVMFGDQLLKEIIKKNENKFWKDTVRSTTELLKGACA